MKRLGIDIGGTAIKYGLVEDGSILSLNQIPTPIKEGYETVLSSIADAGKKMIENNDAEEIGVAVPGLINTLDGEVLYSNNFYWNNKPIANDLARRFGLPVRIANDAQAAALGEAVYGAGKGYDRVAMITIGTGIGGGFVKNGELDEDLYGGMAYIFGHTIFMKDGKHCNCGRDGCYEAYASARAVEKNYYEKTKQEKTAKEIFESIQTDLNAKTIVDNFVDVIGSLLADVSNVFRPEIIAIGGGVSGSADIFISPVKQKFSKQVYGWNYAPIKIVPAVLGNCAGIIGAANLNTKAHRGDGL